MYAMRRDFAYAFRQLVRHPRFAATIILPVAVALGLSTAVATIADALLIKNLPYPDADRLVRIDGVFTRLPLRVTESGLELTAPLSAPEISSARSLAAVGMYSVGGLNAGGDHPRRLRAATVTPGFFDALRMSPHLGHVFTERDVADASRVVVISARLWHAYFQSEPDVIGRVLHLNGRSFVVMAVMPDEFDFPEETAVWIPTGSDAQVASQVAVPQFIARLQTGATTPLAQQEVLQILSRDTLTRQDPDRPTLRVQGLQDALVTNSFRIVVRRLRGAPALADGVSQRVEPHCGARLRPTARIRRETRHRRNHDRRTAPDCVRVVLAGHGGNGVCRCSCG